MFHMDPIRDAEIYGARQEARDRAFLESSQTLFVEAAEAFSHGGAHSIADTTVRQWFSDYLAGPDARTDALIAAIQSAADGKPEARAQAQAVIAGFARAYADFYAEVM